MNYVSYGDKKNKSLLFIHGLASTAALCFGPLLPHLHGYYIVFCEVDGHIPNQHDDMVSMKQCIDQIEDYIQTGLNGKVYGLCGFSMGATIAVELIGRGNISAERVLLDAPLTIEMGLMTLPLTWAFTVGTSRIREGKAIPKCLLGKMMGKDNTGIVDMMYPHISKKTIKSACNYIYHYQIPEKLKDFSNPVLFWRGDGETFPARSEKILRTYLPHMKTELFEGMGHGQFLREYPKEYAEKLRTFLQ